MLNFDENRVRTEHQNGVNLIPEVEKIVDQVCQEGYSNIFLFGIGGTLQPLMPLLVQWCRDL